MISQKFKKDLQQKLSEKAIYTISHYIHTHSTICINCNLDKFQKWKQIVTSRCAGNDNSRFHAECVSLIKGGNLSLCDTKR